MVMQPPTKTFDLSTYNPIIDNVILTQTTSCKFLGITIDESLSWNKHILNINSKLSRALFVIKQVKFYLPKESLHTLYYSLLHPHITYGILAWGNAKASLLRKTQIYKNDLLEPSIIKNSSHSDPLFRQSGILKISDWYQIEVMTFMHDFANEKLPVSFKDVYKMNCNIHGIHETRQAHLFHIPRTKSRFVDILPLDLSIPWDME